MYVVRTFFSISVIVCFLMVLTKREDEFSFYNRT